LADREKDMSETDRHGEQKITQKPKKKKKAVDRFLAFVREVIALLFWVYVVTKLFIFDIDIFLVEKISPSYVWLLNYKFFILIGTVAIIWLVTKNKYILLWTLYIIFYPAIILFWKIPFFIFKQKSWTLAFAVFDAIISFFRSFKFTFITTAFFLVALAIILGFSSETLLWFSSATLLIILLIVYIQKFISIFKPSGVYQVYNKFFSGFGDFLSSSPIYQMDEEVATLAIENMDEKQLQKWTSNVQIFVLFNRVCLFVAKKLKSFQESSSSLVSSVFSILILIVFTVLTFSAVNYGIFKINQEYFSVSGVPTFFDFFYYSFNVLLFNQIQEITATTPISQTLSMLESFFALFLVAIFVSLVLSVKSQRYAEELKEAVKGLEDEGKKMEGYIRENYRLNSIEEALGALQNLQSVVTDFLFKISESLK
jgi:hypothetical protein